MSLGLSLEWCFPNSFLIANRMIGVSEFVFYFPAKAMLLTVVVMGLVFFGIAYFTPKFIRKKEVVKLLKAEAKDDKRQNLVPILVAFLVVAPLSIWALVGTSDFSRSMQESFFLPFLLILACCAGNLSSSFFWNASVVDISEEKPIQCPLVVYRRSTGKIENQCTKHDNFCAPVCGGLFCGYSFVFLVHQCEV